MLLIKLWRWLTAGPKTISQGLLAARLQRAIDLLTDDITRSQAFLASERSAHSVRRHQDMLLAMQKERERFVEQLAQVDPFYYPELHTFLLQEGWDVKFLADGTFTMQPPSEQSNLSSERSLDEVLATFQESGG